MLRFSHQNKWIHWVIGISLIINGFVRADVVFEEHFDDLDAWEELSFSGKSETDYVSNGGVLEIKAVTSASGIGTRESWESSDNLYLVWRWRCDQWPTLQDHDLKFGDDYALRVFLIFEKEQNWLAETLGVPPTECALAYTFSSVDDGVDFRTSPYSDSVVIIPLRVATETKGEWLVEERNISEDFRATFGQEIPPRFRLGIMGDADDSKSGGLAFLDYIQLVERSSSSEDIN